MEHSIDREKVIKGLEELCGFIFREYANIPAEESKIYYDRTCAIRDAIALLKEQEAKTVSHIRTVAYRTIGYCPSCGRGLDSYEDGNSGDHITHFCYNCGQAVKWDD